ncbi:MAG: hypothetical protein B6244_09705 [Candidatus Cloacimonetes bacterium 4572_55]|nr:MAG: hypothetical protein B6244_09705 [Candidatus Cloacimonetes bacterium 4572_55]
MIGNISLSIGIIAHSYLPVSGGIQTYIHANAKEFVRFGHRVHVIVPNNSLNKARHTVMDGVHVHRTRIDNIDWSYPVEDNHIGGWETHKDHRRWGAQVVQMAMEALPIIKKVWQFHKIPYVDSMYGFFTDYHPSLEMRAASRNFYENGGMGAVIVVGDHVRRQCESGKIPKRLLRVVNPSVDFERFDPERLTDEVIKKFNLPITKKTKVLFCPIRLQERKGFKCALHTFSKIKKRYPDCHLIISGGSSANPAGIEKPLSAYHRITDELDIVDQCSLLLNRINDEEMISFYKLADVVFMPSLQEGFGISILEALAMKRPIVATDIPPFRESSGDYALFFEPNHAEGAARAILKTLEYDNQIVNQVERGFRHVRNRYNAARLAKQMLGVYEEILSQKNPIGFSHIGSF